MADVTISQLTPGTPSGNALLPYSTGSNTLGVPVSAIFQNAGNIGIGTTSPSYLLDLRQNNNEALINIEGSSDNIAIRLRNNQIGGREYRIISTAQGSGYGTGALAFEDNTLGGARMVINNTGNVGIGTINPTAKLHVNGDVRSTTTTKAWVSFNGQGAVNQNQSIYSQYNVSSVVKAGDGKYTVYFANALTNTNYCIIGTAGGTGGVWGAYVGAQWGDSEGGLQNTTDFRIGVFSYTNWRNMSIVNVVVYGN